MRRSFPATVCALVVLFAAPVRAETGVDEGDAACTLLDVGCFLSRDGAFVDEAAAYREVVRRGRPHYLRAAVEMGLALGIGTAWYWIDRERQVADWDYPSWQERVTLEAWRFDNNPFGINFAWHAFNGTGFHLMSRANDLSLSSSVGYGFATSMAWELLFEFREKVSVNDTIVTTGAGIAFGEFFHWLGRYVRSAPASAGLGHGVARWTAGLPFAVHDAIDGRAAGPSAAPDRLGLRPDIWHRFELSYGVSTADAEGGDLRLHRLALEGRLVALPGYLRPGRLRRWFADANVTALSVEAGLGGGGSGIDARADTMIVGHHRQRVSRSGGGWALTAGIPIAYRYQRESFDAWEDRLALMHLPGIGVDAVVTGGAWSLHVEGRAHGDFVGVHALAHERWKEQNGAAVEKTILRKQGYYYGWGWSGRGRVRLSLPWGSIGASAFYGSYASQEGLDRSQERITADVELTDSVREYEAWIRAYPLGALYLEGRWARDERRATHDGLRAGQDLTRLDVAVGLEL